MDKATQEIINGQIENKFGQFVKEELNTVLKKLKAEKIQALTKYLQTYEKQGNLMIYFFNYAT